MHAVLSLHGFSQERSEDKRTLSLHSEWPGAKAFPQIRLTVIVVVATMMLFEYLLSMC